MEAGQLNHSLVQPNEGRGINLIQLTSSAQDINQDSQTPGTRSKKSSKSPKRKRDSQKRLVMQVPFEQHKRAQSCLTKYQMVKVRNPTGLSPGSVAGPPKPQNLDAQHYDLKCENASEVVACICTVCNIDNPLIREQREQGLQLKRELEAYVLTQGRSQNFRWLVERMFSPVDDILGCQVQFPETVFFQDGKPKFIVRTDKNGCVYPVTQETKLSLFDIRRTFSTIVRRRKKDTRTQVREMIALQDSSVKSVSPKRTPVKQLKINQSFKRQQSQSKLSQFDRLTRASSLDNKSIGTFQRKTTSTKSVKGGQTRFEQQLKEVEFREVALFKYRPTRSNPAQTTKTVGELEFINIFKRRQNDDYWKSVDFVQTMIKAQLGIGTAIISYFEAPMCLHNPKEDIKYDFKAFGDDSYLQQRDAEKFCMKQCYKIGFYLQKIYCQEILRMKCQFMKDDNGKIWLVEVSSIITRPMPSEFAQDDYLRTPFWIKQLKRPNNASNKALRKKYVAELERHHAEKRKKHRNSAVRVSNFEDPMINKLEDIMKGCFNSIKDKVGVEEIVDYNLDDPTTFDAYKELRPKTKFNFGEVLQIKSEKERRKHRSMNRLQFCKSKHRSKGSVDVELEKSYYDGKIKGSKSKWVQHKLTQEGLLYEQFPTREQVAQQIFGGGYKQLTKQRKASQKVKEVEKQFANASSKRANNQSTVRKDIPNESIDSRNQYLNEDLNKTWKVNRTQIQKIRAQSRRSKHRKQKSSYIDQLDKYKRNSIFKGDMSSEVQSNITQLTAGSKSILDRTGTTQDQTAPQISFSQYTATNRTSQNQRKICRSSNYSKAKKQTKAHIKASRVSVVRNVASGAGRDVDSTSVSSISGATRYRYRSSRSGVSRAGRRPQSNYVHPASHANNALSIKQSILAKQVLSPNSRVPLTDVSLQQSGFKTKSDVTSLQFQEQQTQNRKRFMKYISITSGNRLGQTPVSSEPGIVPTERPRTASQAFVLEKEYRKELSLAKEKMIESSYEPKGNSFTRDRSQKINKVMKNYRSKESLQNNLVDYTEGSDISNTYILLDGQNMNQTPSKRYQTSGSSELQIGLTKKLGKKPRMKDHNLDEIVRKNKGDSVEAAEGLIHSMEQDLDGNISPQSPDKIMAHDQSEIECVRQSILKPTL